MKRSLLIRIDCDPPARLWQGEGDLVIPADAIEAQPARYLGGGQLVSVPDLEQLISGKSAVLDIGVSGVSAQTQALALEESASVDGADVDVGFAYFDDAWQLMRVEWARRYTAGKLVLSDQPSGDGRTRSITLSVSTENVSRSRAPAAFWTDQDQLRRSPDDRFFDGVASITSGTSRRFGPSD